MTLRRYEGGVLRYWEDDITRTVRTFTAAGVEILPATPYTAAQNAAADAEAAEAAARAAREATRAAVKLIITDLQAEKARCDTVLAKGNNQITGGDTKNVAQAAKRIADAAIELARFVQDLS